LNVLTFVSLVFQVFGWGALVGGFGPDIALAYFVLALGTGLFGLKYKMDKKRAEG
jgi:hypothetical protein